MIQLSVVTGTYNRLKCLQDMISSVRFSIGLGIPYEIVVVDGGSTDGSLEYLRKQTDVKLIEQGKLMGAVKAFQEGFRNASGKYIVIGNDDIIYINECLRNALRFMQDHPWVGVGCFHQNRYGKDWHVEMMQCQDVAGRVVFNPYGQVCIVPKWLGDKVNWWSDLYHTYAGDCELSCNILELGYEVAAIAESCIVDLAIDDKLRELNGGAVQYLHSGKHPDSELWRERWYGQGKRGPVIHNKPKSSLPLEYEKRSNRVLYAPIYDPPYRDLMAKTRHGLRDALSKVSLVTEVDLLKDPLYILDVAAAWQPDLFLFQIQHQSNFPEAYLAELKVDHRNAIFVNWNGDYHKNILFDPAYISMMQRFDLALFATTSIKEVYEKAGIQWGYWQIGFEEASPISQSAPKHDVVFLGNGYSPWRYKLAQTILSTNLRVGLYGSWDRKLPHQPSNIYDFSAGASLYRNAKMAVSDSQWPEATGYVSNRLFQAMSAGGAMILQQYVDGLDENIGYKDGVHYRLWHDLGELKSLILHYHSHEAERAAIAEAGYQFTLQTQSFDCRVKQLFDRLEWSYAAIK